MISEFKFDVFVSYNKIDEEMARNIAEYLESYNTGKRQIRVFFAPWDIRPGDNFINLINEGLAQAKFFALVLSSEALHAEWPTAESAAALLCDPSGRMGRVIPILVKSCKLPPLLAIRNWLDLRDKSKFDTGMQKMLCVIKEEPLPRGTNSLGTKRVTESGISTFIENKASQPDQIDENVHTNLFPVIRAPSVLWKASTQFWEKHTIYKQFGEKLPSFILKEKHLYTFSNLSEKNNPLRFSIDIKTIESANMRDWFNDKDKARWLIDLLGSEIRQFCKNIGLYFDKTGKQFYGDKKVITGEKISWTAHVRKGKRGLIIPYTKKDKETGKETTYFFRHRAVGLKFQILGSELFLQIDPGWEFSKDGSILIQGKRRGVLNTKLQSRIKNNVEFDEMRFWAWLLSDGTNITMGSGDYAIKIDSNPLAFKTSCGVYGDHKPIPNVIEEPPSLIDVDDDSEIVIDDTELDEDVEKVKYNDI